MKNALVQLGLVMLGVTSVHAVKLFQTASLHVRISPGYGADKVWAIHGTDTIRMLGNDEEFFVNNLNPGNWRIWIETKKPYSDAGMDAMNLRPGMNKDLGQIRLENNCK
jgi:hypothetical protein